MHQPRFAANCHKARLIFPNIWYELKNTVVALTLLALTIASDPLPQFHVKFVMVREQHNNMEIYDATKHLDLVGYTFMRMMDIIPAIPLVILSGRTREFPFEDKTYWPYKILGSGQVAAAYSDYPSFSLSKRHATVSPRRKGWKFIARRKQADPQPPEFFKNWTSGNIPSWALADVKKWSLNGFEPHAGYSVCRMPYGDLINLTYFPITPGYESCMHDAESVSGYISTGKSVVSLDKCTDGGYRIRGIVWASKDGWLVARATKDGVDGFAWLYLKKNKSR